MILTSFFLNYFQERRHDEFVSIKKDIIACMSDLEQEPETSFEMDVMCEDEEGFCLSDDNIAALKLLLGQVTLVSTQKMKHLGTGLKGKRSIGENEGNEVVGRSVSLIPFVVFQLQQRKIEKELCFLDFRTKIKGLWERLQVPQEEREAFSDHMVESKKRNMEAVRKLPQLCSLVTTERFIQTPSVSPAANRASASRGAENEQH